MCIRTRMYTYTIFNIDLSSLETAQTCNILQYHYKDSHGSPAIVFFLFDLISPVFQRESSDGHVFY